MGTDINQAPPLNLPPPGSRDAEFADKERFCATLMRHALRQASCQETPLYVCRECLPDKGLKKWFDWTITIQSQEFPQIEEEGCVIPPPKKVSTRCSICRKHIASISIELLAKYLGSVPLLRCHLLKY